MNEDIKSPLIIGKIPTPIKIKLALPPLLKKPRTPPPLKGGILWAWGFSSRKNQKMPGAHKIGAAISGPRITGGNFMDTRIFLKLTSAENVFGVPWIILSSLLLALWEQQNDETNGVATCEHYSQKRAEYGFGEYGFKHRAQWVFLGSLSSGEPTQWVPLSLLFVRQGELTEFFAELTEFAVKLSEFSSPKQYSRNSIPPVPYIHLVAPKRCDL